MRSLFKSKLKSLIFAIASAVFLFVGGICLAALTDENASAAGTYNFHCEGGSAYKITTIYDVISDWGMGGFDSNYTTLSYGQYILPANNGIWSLNNVDFGDPPHVFDIRIVVKDNATGQKVNGNAVKFIFCEDAYTFDQTGNGTSDYFGTDEWGYLTCGAGGFFDVCIQNLTSRELLIEEFWMLRDKTKYEEFSVNMDKYHTYKIIDKPTKYGYDFVGWKDVPMGVASATDVLYESEGRYVLTESTSAKDIYAHWTPMQVEVTLENGESTTTTTATYDQLLNTQVPTRNGYIFEGYYTSADGKGTKYVDEKGNGVKNWNYTVPKTLYANWVATWPADGVQPEGSGTNTNPYLIASTQNLAWVANECNNNGVTFSGQYFKQTADIDLDGKYWEAIGTMDNPFAAASYDGNNKKISNIKTHDSFSYAGVFGVTSSSSLIELANIVVESGEINVSANGYAGGIVAQAGNARIVNCTNKANFYSGRYVGGIVGDLKGSIDGCYNLGDFTFNTYVSYVGGIVGSYGGSLLQYVQNCYNDGDITANVPSYVVGGIIGSLSCFRAGVQYEANTSIGYCVNAGNISVQDTHCAGGIVGSVGISGGRVVFNKCTVLGDVISKVKVSQGDISSNTNYVAGIVGYTNYSGSSAQYTIFGCYVNATVCGSSAGMVGRVRMDDGAMDIQIISSAFNAKDSYITSGFFTLTQLEVSIQDSLLITANAEMSAGRVQFSYDDSSWYCSIDNSVLLHGGNVQMIAPDGSFDYSNWCGTLPQMFPKDLAWYPTPNPI